MITEVKGRKNKRKISVLGVKAQHTPEEANFLWEFIMKKKPEKIVEIGTGRGAVTLLLGFYAIIHNAEVLTIEHNPMKLHERYLKLKEKLPITQIIGDAWNRETLEQVREFTKNRTQDRPIFIYCDGGDKTKDIEKYAPLLKQNDYIAAHDMQSFMNRSQLKKTMKKHKLKERKLYSKIYLLKKISK